MPAYEVQIVMVVVISDANVDLNNVNASGLVTVKINVNNTLGMLQVNAYSLHCSSPALPPSIIAKLTMSYKILTDYQTSTSGPQIQPLSLIVSPSVTSSPQSRISIK